MSLAFFDLKMGATLAIFFSFFDGMMPISKD
jgi:hypothetical protein